MRRRYIYIYIYRERERERERERDGDIYAAFLLTCIYIYPFLLINHIITFV
jgi:hypothetical protein